MKKITSAFLILGLMGGAASAAPSYIQRDGRYGYNVTYDYTDKAKSGWYLTGRAELAFWNWKNKYSLDNATVDDITNIDLGSDKYSFEPVFGGSVSFGKKIRHLWRLEGEAGYLGYFEDKDNGVDFSMSAPYALINGYYDFSNGLYVGLGAGAAMVIKTLDEQDFISGDRRDISVSPMGAVMLGWTHKLDDNFVIDLRYRLAGFDGGDQSRRRPVWSTVPDADGYYPEIGTVDLKVDAGFVLDNSISIGLRYEF